MHFIGRYPITTTLIVQCLLQYVGDGLRSFSRCWDDFKIKDASLFFLGFGSIIFFDYLRADGYTAYVLMKAAFSTALFMFTGYNFIAFLDEYLERQQKWIDLRNDLGNMKNSANWQKLIQFQYVVNIARFLYWWNQV